MISDEQLDQFQDSLCKWLTENPRNATMVLDRKILSELVPELKSHRRPSALYFEQLSVASSSSVDAVWEKLRDLSSDIEEIIIFRWIVGYGAESPRKG